MSAVVGPPGIVGLPLDAVVWPPLGIVDLLPGVLVVTALVWPLLIVAGTVVVAPLVTVVVIAFGVANLGHPKFVASPNACSFASPSSSVELVAEVFVGSSTDALSNDGPCSHSSSLRVSLHKKMGLFDSRPTLSCSSASDTNVLPTDATTNHCRRRCPRLRQGRRIHTSQAALSTQVVRQTRWAAADQY